MALCAVGVGVFRYWYVPPLEWISGLEVVSTNVEKKGEVRFDTNATYRTAEHLFANMAEGYDLQFIDTNCQCCEREVLVISHHTGDEYLTYFFGHHSYTDLFPLTKSELVQYLWACHADNSPGAKRSYHDDRVMQFQPSQRLSKRPIDRDVDLRCLAYIRTRIGQPKVTLEKTTHD